MLLFLCFSLCATKFQLFKAGREGIGRRHYSEAGLKRTYFNGKQKEIPSPPMVLRLHPRTAGWGGSRQNQKHAACYEARYHV